MEITIFGLVVLIFKIIVAIAIVQLLIVVVPLVVCALAGIFAITLAAIGEWRQGQKEKK